MIGSLKEIIRDMKNGVTDFTKDGKCSSCGQCCSNLLPISEKEEKAIKRYIEKHNITEQRHCFPTVKELADLTCPFRSETKRECLIYPVRPLICRDFRCDKPKKRIERDKTFYHNKYFVYDMRETFYGGNDDNS